MDFDNFGGHNIKSDQILSTVISPDEWRTKFEYGQGESI